MRTTPRRTAAGAIGASVLLLVATACSSSSDDSAGESLPGAAVEATDTAAPGTDATSAATAAPSDTGTVAGTDDPATTATPDDQAPTAPVGEAPEALQFSAPLVGGGTFDGAAAAGKPMVFWFWAPT